MPFSDLGHWKPLTINTFTRLMPFENQPVAYSLCIYNVTMYTWDEAKRLRNLKDHGIDFSGLVDFFDGDLMTREDTREAYREQRFQSVGVSNGVVLYVVWTPRGMDVSTPHLISARKAEKHETKKWQSRYQKR